MAEKILNTRIQLKYDTWANWQTIKDTFFPKRGEICLVEQPFVKDPSVSVGNFAKANGATIVKVVRYGVGEGIQKREENFAEEVAKQMK